MTEFYETNYRRYLPKNKDAKILEIGHGNGAFILWLYSKNYSDITGIEKDIDCLTFLKTSKETYDFIICRHVMYYFKRDELQDWISAMHGALKPNGRLMIEVFNAFGVFGTWPCYVDPTITIAFNDVSFKKLLESGFDNVLIYEGIMPGHGFKHFLWVLFRQIWFSILKVAMILERGIDINNPKIFGKNIIGMAIK